MGARLACTRARGFHAPRAVLIVGGKVVLEYTDEAWLPDLNTLSLHSWGKVRFDKVRVYTAGAG